jgi:hypothetical protein
MSMDSISSGLSPVTAVTSCPPTPIWANPSRMIGTPSTT